MRTNVTFKYPAVFVPLSDEDGILAVSGAQWFTALLRRLPGLHIDRDPCQEDWGVVFFVRRNGKKYWVGLSAWESEGAWIAHFHHGAFASLQWFGLTGSRELRLLLVDVHKVLASEALISEISWHEESEINKPQPAGSPTPIEAD